LIAINIMLRRQFGNLGSSRGHVTYFFIFCTPFISRERWKLEKSNLAYTLATGCLNDIMQN